MIAGGAGGIGRELVNACLANGCEPVVLDLPAAIDAVYPSADFPLIGCDAADEEGLSAALGEIARRFDAIDGFVFLTGYQLHPRRRLEETSAADWDRLLAVNLTSFQRLCAALLPLLAAGTGGAIVAVSSALAVQPRAGMSAYSASKGGLVSLTKAIAVEAAPKVRANVVAPGAVETEFLSGGAALPEAERDSSGFDDHREAYAASIPLGRIATPEDIVGPIMFLLGDASRYMTGQVLHLNGGRLTV